MSYTKGELTQKFAEQSAAFTDNQPQSENERVAELEERRALNAGMSDDPGASARNMGLMERGFEATSLNYDDLAGTGKGGAQNRETTMRRIQQQQMIDHLNAMLDDIAESLDALDTLKDMYIKNDGKLPSPEQDPDVAELLLLAGVNYEDIQERGLEAFEAAKEEIQNKKERYKNIIREGEKLDLNDPAFEQKSSVLGQETDAVLKVDKGIAELSNDDQLSAVENTNLTDEEKRFYKEQANSGFGFEDQTGKTTSASKSDGYLIKADSIKDEFTKAADPDGVNQAQPDIAPEAAPHINNALGNRF